MLLFTNGQLTFAALFFITFVIVIAWTYRVDKAVNRAYFKGSYKILLFILLVLVVLYGIVKIKRMMYP
jgi:heme A synthase